jgi:ABC-type multidrug transport system ATPase subunit
MAKETDAVFNRDFVESGAEKSFALGDEEKGVGTLAPEASESSDIRPDPLDVSNAPADGHLPVIRASRLTLCVKQGGKTKQILTDISVSINGGQLVGVIGASGSGKSTFVQSISGIRRVGAGSASVAGWDVRMLASKLPLVIGYLPQTAGFHQELSVRELISSAVALRLPRSVPTAVRAQWADHVVALSGLESLLDQTYCTLSGGQMRRMALAEALIGDPQFLFLDELTSGLDPYSDREIMEWMRKLAHEHDKTVIIVTHATYHLHLCDSVIFLHQGHLVYHGPYLTLLEVHGVESVADLFGLYQTGQYEVTSADRNAAIVDEPSPGMAPRPLRTRRPPSGFWQFPTLLRRQAVLFWRDKGQLWLQGTLILTFPALVAVFALHGLPQVRNLNLALETNVVRTLEDSLFYLKESFHAASLISGLAMFQVILLSLMGANNGAREIAKEKDILEKELRAGLSATAYVAVKFIQILFLSGLQASWMAWFVKIVCGFPGDLLGQFGILFASTLAMSCACLAISAAASSPERASLLSIYLVGFQLPLSGAAIALPEWLSHLCRPWIVAYWGWSGYLKTLHATRNYDIVQQSTRTAIADYPISLVVLALHVVVGVALARYFVARKCNAA